MAAAAVLAAVLAGCGSNAGTTSTAHDSTVRPAVEAASGGAGQALSGTVTVFAAASLDRTFTELGKRFEAAHPGVNVKFSFGGSDSLAAQITEGAPADVFAAASTTTMGIVTKAGDAAGDPVVFVRNELEIAVAPGDPLRIATLADLAGPGVKVALCAPSVPCGAAAQKALKAARVHLTPVTQEQDVTSALTKVELGSVDAALVYHTDVAGAAGKVSGIDFAAAASAINTYPVTVLKDAPNPAAAQAFEQYLLSSAGESVLLQAGFLKP
ncbi:molybdate ABC transporter substrate-binding protein [Actinocrinis puniceicyclus]|uniref:Molybdate ABC transporter substrate-binding protein n=1 Tax=Actinocrinis puniceicyclus TaxID=977794 RepID=A0A8J7WK79_9ACTN|nr:molybdate ABC transporter substrate-binding protein [Actinocrinis puniceicyclus]MBS2961647.1 molybdate ABC transporter substrate-binding protein [Actinocrinis puniceicyclus]